MCVCLSFTLLSYGCAFPSQVLASWLDYDMAELRSAAEFEALALTSHAAGGGGEQPLALASQTLASAGLEGRVAINVWQLDAPTNGGR